MDDFANSFTVVKIHSMKVAAGGSTYVYSNTVLKYSFKVLVLDLKISI